DIDLICNENDTQRHIPWACAFSAHQPLRSPQQTAMMRVASHPLKRATFMNYQCLAAIDIGSNTVHLLVAATDGRQLTVLDDESIFIHLAADVWQTGVISEKGILTTAQAVWHLRDIARGYGAEHIIVVATEVARTAKNAAALLNIVSATTGLEPLVLS